MQRDNLDKKLYQSQIWVANKRHSRRNRNWTGIIDLQRICGKTWWQNLGEK